MGYTTWGTWTATAGFITGWVTTGACAIGDAPVGAPKAPNGLFPPPNVNKLSLLEVVGWGLVFIPACCACILFQAAAAGLTYPVPFPVITWFGASL